MVEVDVLMNLNQFCRAQPHASTFYGDPQSYVRQGGMEIGLSAIVSVVEPPIIILDWDPQTFTADFCTGLSLTECGDTHCTA